MFKIYINRFKSRKHPEEGIEYWFCSDGANAVCWATKEEAESDGMIIENNPFKIHSSQGAPHFCTGFKIEQRAPNEFVIFYEVPFIPAEATPVDAAPESAGDETTAS
jgi:hypothetical protein